MCFPCVFLKSLDRFLLVKLIGLSRHFFLPFQEGTGMAGAVDGDCGREGMKKAETFAGLGFRRFSVSMLYYISESFL